MDNLTHSLFSAGVASPFLAFAPTRFWGRAMLGAALLAGNAPDLDILMQLVDGSKANYLLHHRGHTHTFAVLAPGGLALGLLMGWAPFLAHPSRRALTVTALVGVLCALGHVWLDSWNIYGVHPLWPWDNRWFFGDWVFILDPLLWLALFLVAVGRLSPRVRWWSLGAIAALALGLSWQVQSGPVTGGLAVAIAATAVLLFFVGRVNRYWPLGLTAAVLTCGYLGMLGRLSSHAKIVAQTVAAKAMGEDCAIMDVAVSPSPADPTCWRFWALGVAIARREYSVAVGDLRMGLTGSFSTLESCFPERGDGGRTLQLAPVADHPWLWAWRGSTVLLEGALRTCVGRDFAVFLRFPFYENGVLGDLRFDHDVGLGFAETVISPEDGPCPVQDPPRVPWIPPTAAWVSLP